MDFERRVRTVSYRTLKFASAAFNFAGEQFLPRERVWMEYAGYDLLVDPRDHIGTQLYISGEYEPEIGAILAERTPTNGIAVEIGAHLGHHSLQMRQKTGSEGTIYAVEPHPINADIIRQTISQNGFENVHCKEAAVGGEEGQIGLIEHKTQNSGASTISDVEGDTTYTVDVTTLPLLYDTCGLDHADTIKIDVEGAEYDILSGIDNLSDYTDFAVIELHGKDHLTDAEMDELRTSLKNWGSNLSLQPSEPAASIDNQSNVTAIWES